MEYAGARVCGPSPMPKRERGVWLAQTQHSCSARVAWPSRPDPLPAHHSWRRGRRRHVAQLRSRRTNCGRGLAVSCAGDGDRGRPTTGIDSHRTAGERHGVRAVRSTRALTMIELLVVMGVIALLASILLPSMAGARASANRVLCSANLAQVVRANLYYADENESAFCPGAVEFLENNLHRWHGTRTNTSEPFDPTEGPLTPYLGEDGLIRQCPAFPVDAIVDQGDAWEKGNGGYGYNNNYIGMQIPYTKESHRSGVKTHQVKRPGETVMFADTAFAANSLIDYSFVEPRFHPRYPLYRTDPSTHFRHRGVANVGWVDGHVDSRRMTFTWKSGMYPADPKRYGIGWFGDSDDNRLYDLD